MFTWYLFKFIKYIRVLYNLFRFVMIYCPNGGVSASWDHLCLILFNTMQIKKIRKLKVTVFDSQGVANDFP